MYSLPMLLTWMRVALIPLFVVLYYLPIEDARFWSGVAFMTAAITDGLDGWLARRFGQTSKLGAFVDPIADKLAVGAALVMVAAEYQNLWVTLSAIVIITRELAVSGLREWMAEHQLRDVVAVSKLGKWKTAIQLTALVWLIYGGTLWGVNWGALGFPALYLAAVLTLITWVEYFRAAWPALRETLR
ncbi:CDP-diacylglycerol--glycerol-3-phosphate 3-phosphatidyltransferase [Sulfurivirga sp.]|uniref:CDP-diacylglycerol--glycerol-3-phosphate 3-phosphatidyltransferase n=1 Tax=Sulfurivirga sp. TaxID=2614236 RepID=UPI0025CEA8FB|nr:CDP-diacylglycerol--glycerol-3-phosphate 3-phosphatidyltransferase [Sulfurivirga sp.]